MFASHLPLSPAKRKKLQDTLSAFMHAPTEACESLANDHYVMQPTQMTLIWRWFLKNSRAVKERAHLRIV